MMYSGLFQDQSLLWFMDVSFSDTSFTCIMQNKNNQFDIILTTGPLKCLQLCPQELLFLTKNAMFWLSLVKALTIQLDGTPKEDVSFSLFFIFLLLAAVILVFFNLFNGTVLCLAGFGNLPGNMVSAISCNVLIYLIVSTGFMFSVP